MASYLLNDTIEAHALGSGDEPTWFKRACLNGDIKQREPGKYQVGTVSGWVSCVAGDYVVFIEPLVDANGRTERAACYEVIPKVPFESSYHITATPEVPEPPEPEAA